jgi:hypothetical protein
MARLRNRPTKAAVLNDPNPAQPFPCELKPGGVWRGLTPQEPELVDWGRNGGLYFDLYHSHRAKPVRKRVRFQSPRKRERISLNSFRIHPAPLRAVKALTTSEVNSCGQLHPSLRSSSRITSNCGRVTLSTLAGSASCSSSKTRVSIRCRLLKASDGEGNTGPLVSDMWRLRLTYPANCLQRRGKIDH